VSASKALEEAHALIQSLFSAMPVGIVLCDGEGNIQASNRSTEKLFGHSARNLSTLNLKQLLNVRESSNMREWIAQSLGKTTNVEGFQANGSAVPIDVTIEYIGSNTDKVLVCLYDVSERHKLEQLKRDFLHMIVHDLRTPLSSIRCFLEGVAVGQYDRQIDGARTRAANCDAELQRLIGLINNILDLEKLNSTDIKITPSTFVVDNLLKNACHSVQALSDSRGIQIVTNDTDFELYADEDQILQVCINLLGNAIKFSPDRGVVHFSALQKNGMVEFHVIDQGPGVPREDRERIFNRFEQTASGAKQKNSSGLGLAICKALVTAHGGAIGTEGAPEGGSDFWFCVPTLGLQSFADEDA